MRSIAVKPVVTKIFKRIIYDQLYLCKTMNSFLLVINLVIHAYGFNEATDGWAMNIDHDILFRKLQH